MFLFLFLYVHGSFTNVFIKEMFTDFFVNSSFRYKIHFFFSVDYIIYTSVYTRFMLRGF